MQYDFYLNLERPLLPRFKPAAGMAIASGIGAIVSSVVSYAASERANEKNEELMNKQLAYQTSERLATQSYNTPLAQSARYQAAGINPYMALGNLSSGNTNFQTGVSAPDIKANAAFADMMQNLGNIPSQIMQYQQMSEQVSGQQEANKQARVETLYKGQSKLLELQKMRSEISEKQMSVKKGSEEYNNLKFQGSLLDRQIKIVDNELRYQDDYLKARNRKERETADLVHSQTKGQLLQNEYQQMYNGVFPKLNQKQLELLGAQTYQAVKAGDLSSEMSTSEWYKQIGIVLDNELKSGNIKLQELDLTKAEIEQMKHGKISDALKKHPTLLRIKSSLESFGQDFSKINPLSSLLK